MAGSTAPLPAQMILQQADATPQPGLAEPRPVHENPCFCGQTFRYRHAQSRGDREAREIMIGKCRKLSVSIPLATLVALAPLFAVAQAPQFLGTYRDWNVYRFEDGEQTICYMASEPKKQEGDYTRRGNPAVLVTRRPGPNSGDEVSVQPGYSYLAGSEVEVQVDDQREFSLFTKGEHAWTKSTEDDRALINAMRRGTDMTVRGTSVKDTYSLDTYSLMGFTAAYEAMSEACDEESS